MTDETADERPLKATGCISESLLRSKRGIAGLQSGLTSQAVTSILVYAWGGRQPSIGESAAEHWGLVCGNSELGRQQTFESTLTSNRPIPIFRGPDPRTSINDEEPFDIGKQGSDLLHAMSSINVRIRLRNRHFEFA